MQSVVGPDQDAVNTFAKPEVIHQDDSQIGAGNDFEVTIPKLSVSVLVVPVR